MDQILDSAEWIAFQKEVLNFPVFELFWTPHCLMMSLLLRRTFLDKSYAQKNPLATYLMAVLYTFPGGILATLLLAKPVLSFTVDNTSALVQMTLSWYLIFFSPFDIVATLIDGIPGLKTAFAASQDFFRMYLVWTGVKAVHGMHPGAFVYPVVFATAKSSGFLVVKYFQDLFVTRKSAPFSLSNYPTKSCFLASVAFTAASFDYIRIPVDTLYAMFIPVVVSLRILTSFVPFDPYLLFENIFCRISFGNCKEEQEQGKVQKEKEKKA